MDHLCNGLAYSCLHVSLLLLMQNTKIQMQVNLLIAYERFMIHHILEKSNQPRLTVPHLQNLLPLDKFWYQGEMLCLVRYPIPQSEWIHWNQQKHCYLAWNQYTTSQLENSYRFRLQTRSHLQILRSPKTLCLHMK